MGAKSAFLPLVITIYFSTASSIKGKKLLKSF